MTDETPQTVTYADLIANQAFVDTILGVFAAEEIAPWWAEPWGDPFDPWGW